MTEYGADTIAGLHTTDGTLWSEEYQTALLETYHRVFDRIDAVVGEHVWNFADFATGPSFMRVNGDRRASSPGPPAQDGRPRVAAALDRRQLTGPVECLTTSAPNSSLLEGSSLSMATAALPASPVGVPMVVRGGATMAAMGASSKPTTLTSPGMEIPRALEPGDDAERHLVVEGHDSRRLAVNDSLCDVNGCLESRLGHRELHDRHPRGGAGAPDGIPALAGGPRSRRATEVGQAAVPERRQMVQASATAGAVRNRMEACPWTGRLTKTAGLPSMDSSAR